MKKLQALFLFFFPFFAYRFFDARFIDKSYVNIATFVYVLIAVVVSIPLLFPKRKAFTLPVQLIVFAIFLSMVMAYVSWGQSLKDSLLETMPYLVWIFFFYLIRMKVTVKTVEKIIICYAVIYIILYFFQLANSPTIFFGTSLEGDEYTVDRGIVRIIFPGGGLFVLAAFMAVNKITTQKRNKALWILLALIGLLIPILQVTRVFIAGVLLIYVYHFMHKEKLVRKILVFTLVIAGILIVSNLNNQLVKGLKTASANNAKEGQEYVRFRAASYFVSDFSPNIGSYIFGNGAPYTPFSEYGQEVMKLNKKGYFIEDIGIVGMYAMFGILPLIAYFMIWYKSFTLKIPEEYFYVRYYVWYLLISCVTTFNVYHEFYVVSTIFALYIYQVVYEKQLINATKNDDDLSPLTRKPVRL